MSPWDCPRCTYSNDDVVLQCLMCGCIKSSRDSSDPHEGTTSSTDVLKFLESDHSLSKSSSELKIDLFQSTNGFPPTPIFDHRDVIDLRSPKTLCASSNDKDDEDTLKLSYTREASSVHIISSAKKKVTMTYSMCPKVTSRADGDEFCISGIVDALLYRVDHNNRTSSSPSCAYMCMSDCQHISQLRTHGASWSCGYRNIQMLTSSLRRLPEYRAALLAETGGALPSVHQIQLLIGHAWKQGFDVEVGLYTFIYVQ